MSDYLRTPIRESLLWQKHKIMFQSVFSLKVLSENTRANAPDCQTTCNPSITFYLVDFRSSNIQSIALAEFGLDLRFLTYESFQLGSAEKHHSLLFSHVASKLSRSNLNHLLIRLTTTDASQYSTSNLPVNHPGSV